MGCLIMQMLHFFIVLLSIFILSVILPLAEAKVLKNFILGTIAYFLLIVQ